MGTMNEVSIIINGVRYDAVEGNGCSKCDLLEYCSTHFEPCNIFPRSEHLYIIFKKSDKKFEK